MTAPHITDAEIAELRRLEAAATPGPWTCEIDGDGLGIHVYALLGPKSPMWLGTCPSNMVISTGVPGSIEAPFIAAARNALPRLLAEIERLHAELRKETP